MNSLQTNKDKNMNTLKYILTTITIAFFISSCGHNHKEGDGHDHGHDHSSHAESDGHGHDSHDGHKEGGYHLSKAQAKTIGLKFGDFTSLKVNDFVKATGTLGLPPNAQSSISARADGIIRGTKKFVEGAYIKKGSTIAYLENPDFIKTQQEFLEIKAELALQKLEVDRQKTLVDANAGVLKQLQRAEAREKILSTQAKGLSKQLSYLRISTDELTADNIRDQIIITSSASGYISDINFHDGMYVDRSSKLMEIISSQHLHLELDVFEKDISKIKNGLIISYTVPAYGDVIYQGEVNVIGKEFNSDAKTVRVHGHVSGDKPQFIKDLFINAKIWLSDETVTALPDNAIITDGSTSFVFAANHKLDADKFEFERLGIIPGARTDGFTAVKLIDSIPPGMQIVTEGAYYIYAQSKVGELAHEH